RRNFISETKKFHGIWNKDSSGTEIYYNLIEPGPQGSAIQVEDGSSIVKIYNNTMSIVGGKFGVFLTEYSTGATVKNNIAVNGKAFNVVSGSEVNLVANNNLWFRTDGDVVVWLGTGYTAATFADYQNVSGQDSNSIVDDPLFVDVNNNDYRLESNSPAIDAGTDIGLSQDITGKSIVGLPDIGAYEYTEIAPPKNVRIIFPK
ncbi:MAG: choice-of-anchor Q domain-containing protein, partial [Candidatus Hodarchaeota archaeon]